MGKPFQEQEQRGDKFWKNLVYLPIQNNSYENQSVYLRHTQKLGPVTSDQFWVWLFLDNESTNNFVFMAIWVPVLWSQYVSLSQKT